MNPWHIESIINEAKDRANRNGFRLEPGEGNSIKLVAQKEPYGKNICIGRCADWREVEVFFMGYEQQILEANAVKHLSNTKKAKP